MKLYKFIASIGFWATLTFSANAQVITTTDDLDYSNWGPPTVGDEAFGESFTVPDTANFLQSFTFTSLSSTDTLDYRTYLYSFDTTTGMISGPALYTSDIKTIPSTGSIADVNLINLNLAPGGTYIMFVSDAGLTTPRDAEASMGGTSTQEYIGGSFYGEPTDGYPSGFATNQWTEWPCDNYYNAAFTAVFLDVPEPSASMLAIFGLCCTIVSRSVWLRSLRKLS